MFVWTGKTDLIETPLGVTIKTVLLSNELYSTIESHCLHLPLKHTLGFFRIITFSIPSPVKGAKNGSPSNVSCIFFFFISNIPLLVFSKRNYYSLVMYCVRLK